MPSREPDVRPGSQEPRDAQVDDREVEGVDTTAVIPPVDIIVRVWSDREPEVISPVADWLVCAALNKVLDNYVEYELTPTEEE